MRFSSSFYQIFLRELNEFAQGTNDRPTFDDADRVRLAALEEDVRQLKKTPARANRPKKETLSNLTVLNNGQHVLISSLSETTLVDLLSNKRPHIGAPPVIAGLNHEHAIATLSADLICVMAAHSTAGFSSRIAAYFLTKEAFMTCYFPPFGASNGNSQPKNSDKKALKPAIHQAIHYYCLYLGGALFQDNLGHQRLWLNSVVTSMNAKVARMKLNAKTGTKNHYFTYLNHNPICDEHNFFEQN